MGLRRDTVSVRWDGALFDCDFNQQLAMAMMTSAPPPPQPAAGAGAASTVRVQGPVEHEEGAGQGAGGSKRALSVFDLVSLDELTGRPIRVDNHCFGCTAGSGSSCQGATS